MGIVSRLTLRLEFKFNFRLNQHGMVMEFPDIPIFEELIKSRFFIMLNVLKFT